jgi:hypothetical protein
MWDTICVESDSGSEDVVDGEGKGAAVLIVEDVEVSWGHGGGVPPGVHVEHLDAKGLPDTQYVLGDGVEAGDFGEGGELFAPFAENGPVADGGAKGNDGDEAGLAGGGDVGLGSGLVVVLGDVFVCGVPLFRGPDGVVGAHNVVVSKNDKVYVVGKAGGGFEILGFGVCAGHLEAFGGVEGPEARLWVQPGCEFVDGNLAMTRDAGMAFVTCDGGGVG